MKAIALTLPEAQIELPVVDDRPARQSDQRPNVDDPEFWFWLADQLPQDAYRALRQLYVDYRQLVAERRSPTSPREGVRADGVNLGNT